MTTIGDVIRQIETALTDSQLPPTIHEQEVFYKTLFTLYAGAVDAKSSW
jgi:hypothetical protein